jgi:hypothetical protein
MQVKAIAVAALLSVAAPAVVFAQASTPATPNATTTMNQNAMGSGSVTAPTDFNTFLQGMQGADFTSATSGIDTATQFNIVRLSSLQNSDAAKLQAAIQPHQQDLQSLSGQINANSQAVAALTAQNVSPDQVVWVSKDANGLWTLYVNDLSAAGASGASGSGASATPTTTAPSK